MDRDATTKLWEGWTMLVYLLHLSAQCHAWSELPDCVASGGDRVIDLQQLYTPLVHDVTNIITRAVGSGHLDGHTPQNFQVDAIASLQWKLWENIGRVIEIQGS